MSKVVLTVRNPKTQLPAFDQECRSEKHADRFKKVFEKNGWVVLKEKVLA